MIYETPHSNPTTDVSNASATIDQLAVIDAQLRRIWRLPSIGDHSDTQIGHVTRARHKLLDRIRCLAYMRPARQPTESCHRRVVLRKSIEGVVRTEHATTASRAFASHDLSQFSSTFRFVPREAEFFYARRTTGNKGHTS